MDALRYWLTTPTHQNLFPVWQVRETVQAAMIFADSWIERFIPLEGNQDNVMLHLANLSEFGGNEVAARKRLEPDFEGQRLLRGKDLGRADSLQMSTTRTYTRKHSGTIRHLISREQKFRSHFAEKRPAKERNSLKKREDREILGLENGDRSLEWLRTGVLMKFVPEKIREVGMLLTLVQCREGNSPSTNPQSAKLSGESGLRAAQTPMERVNVNCIRSILNAP